MADWRATRMKLLAGGGKRGVGSREIFEASRVNESQRESALAHSLTMAGGRDVVNGRAGVA